MQLLASGKVRLITVDGRVYEVWNRWLLLQLSVFGILNRLYCGSEQIRYTS